jgi:hypothetical protein
VTANNVSEKQIIYTLQTLMALKNYLQTIAIISEHKFIKNGGGSSRKSQKLLSIEE